MKNKDLKLKVLTNKELIESAFKAIENIGFHVIDVQFDGSYYSYNDCDNSICNFHIREIPRFLFAFWVITRRDSLKTQIENGEILWTDAYHVDSKTELLFFTQYERDLDKFKPSRSGFLTGIYRETWIEQKNDEPNEHQVEEWYMYELEDVLNFMKKHPIKAYVYAGAQINNVVNEVNSIRCLYIFIKEWFYDKKWKFKNWLKFKKQLRASMKLVKVTNDMYNSFIVLRPSNWSPRIDIVIRRKDDFNFEKCLKLEKIFDKFDEKWFGDISLDQYDLELTREPLTGEYIKMDKQQRDNFIRRLTCYYTEPDSEYNILWCNCNNLLDKKVMK